MIYFILEPLDNAVKIGKTQDDKLMIRFSSIQTGNHRKLKLLGVCEGYTEKEKELHKQFKHLRLRGEWFKYEKDLKEYIENNTKQYTKSLSKFPKNFKHSVKYLKNTKNPDQEIVNYIHKKYPYLKEAIDTLGYEFIEKTNYICSNIKKKLITSNPYEENTDKIKKLLLSDYRISCNKFIYIDELKQLLQTIYDSLKMKKKATSTDIETYFVVKNVKYTDKKTNKRKNG